MIHCGLLCKSCTNKCREEAPENRPLRLECPSCRGYGCKECRESGRIHISGCPQSILDGRFKREINKLAFAMETKLLPQSGGVGDQPARFMTLWKRFQSDVNLIESDKAKNE